MYVSTAALAADTEEFRSAVMVNLDFPATVRKLGRCAAEAQDVAALLDRPMSAVRSGFWEAAGVGRIVGIRHRFGQMLFVDE